MEFKDRLASAMKRRGMSQADLCRATGMGTSKVSQILKGKVKDPRLSTAAAISDALGVSLDWLAGRDVTKAAYADPFQAELNRCYEACTPERKARILDTARDAALASGEDAKRDDVQGEGVSA